MDKRDIFIWIIAHVIMVVGVLYILFLINDQYDDDYATDINLGKTTAINILGYHRI